MQHESLTIAKQTHLNLIHAVKISFIRSRSTISTKKKMLLLVIRTFLYNTCSACSHRLVTITRLTLVTYVPGYSRANQVPPHRVRRWVESSTHINHVTWTLTCPGGHENSPENTGPVLLLTFCYATILGQFDIWSVLAQRAKHDLDSKPFGHSKHLGHFLG